MALVVQKYGGSSVADAKSVKRVAKRIAEAKRAGNDVVVVVSAMGDTTDDLLDLAAQISPLPPKREMDILLTAGERISMSLLAMATNNLGIKAKSFTGPQAGVLTDAAYGKARIVDVVPHRIRRTIEKGQVAIVAGFQGVNQKEDDVTTLGRGGSDTTAVALAAGLGADVCEIFTDVDGVFTADPRIVPSARKIHRVTYEEMLELAASGAKVLALRAVEYARRYGVPLHVRSSFSGAPGTLVSGTYGDLIDPNAPDGDEQEEDVMEDPLISGVAHDRSEAKITVTGVPDKPGMAARIFEVVAASGSNIDMIVQNVSAASTGRTDISFTLPEGSGPSALAALRDVKGEVGYENLEFDDQVGKLSLVGAGMKSHPGVSARLFGAVRDAGINIEMISTSEIRISIVTRADSLDEAVRAVHTAFGLDSADGEAVVYAGTGR
ncbi:aspartate kinase [Myceligenerans xiligouense]|uniref:Aspartokinase n=1 Tax=Myceligenerans xiligouense TaxID=253184 RepID=A0A3N4Z3I7_9MICO|nr:aspartate kinase [Myceligenerans xiligouense]RPF19702.1 aspartate kinase [Myceligenerans xiligouense]